MKSVFFVSACASIVSVSSIAFAAAPTAERVAELKAEIRAMANAHVNDNKAAAISTREQLDKLVGELTEAYAPVSATLQLPELQGSWKELWSDDRDGESDYAAAVHSDKKTVFQYISKDGWFYNVSNVTTPVSFIDPVAFLRGQWLVNTDDLSIRFTKVSLRLKPLQPGESVTALVEGVEAGKVFTVGAPGGAKYPNGPVDAQGLLKTTYLDKDFRISTGENLTFNTGVTHLYILDRADSLPPVPALD